MLPSSVFTCSTEDWKSFATTVSKNQEKLHGGRSDPHAQHLWGGVISGVFVVTDGKINIPAGFFAGGTLARLRIAIVKLRVGCEVELFKSSCL